jgi:hypothetical protein
MVWTKAMMNMISGDSWEFHDPSFMNYEYAITKSTEVYEYASISEFIEIVRIEYSWNSEEFFVKREDWK